jgi:hypothetical protein
LGCISLLREYFDEQAPVPVGKTSEYCHIYLHAYWKKRRSEVIDSISFSNAIWLPLKVNQPQSVEQAGNWLLAWYQVSAKYKTGKRMSQWVHTDMHFDANDKIDRYIQYLDHVPINAATKK